MSVLFAQLGTWSDAIKPSLQRVLTGSDAATSGGWGLSGFSAERAVYFGRSAELIGSDTGAFDKAFDKAIHSKPRIFVAQRITSTANPFEVRNAAPFHYRDWIFAQVGLVPRATTLPLQEARPQGGTAEERFFLWLAEKLIPTFDPAEELITLIKDKIRTMPFKNLTFLMSDGKTIWVYHEIDERTLDAGETVADRRKRYALYFTSEQGHMMFCSEPLPELSQAWQPFPNKTLAVINIEPFTSKLLTV